MESKEKKKFQLFFSFYIELYTQEKISEFQFSPKVRMWIQWYIGCVIFTHRSNVVVF